MARDKSVYIVDVTKPGLSFIFMPGVTSYLGVKSPPLYEIEDSS